MSVKKWEHISQKEPYLIEILHFFSYNFFELDKSSEIPEIFHFFILFYGIINYWNIVNKRVVDEYFQVLDLNKHYVCKHL